MIIDFHTHIVPPRIKQNRQAYTQGDRGFAAIFSDRKARLATADDLIAGMDRDGVALSVVLNYGWQTQTLCTEINDYILESVTRFPERLVGFCSVAPAGGEEALREIERCVRSGAKGIGELRPDTQLPAGNRIAAIKPLAEYAIENNLIVLVHASEPVGHQYRGKGEATPDLIYEIITAFPALKLVAAHWGGGLPFYALMPEVKSALRNVYFDTAASPFLYTPQVYRQVAEIIGAEKILFGSDYPLLPPRRLLKQIGKLDLPAETKQKILGDNAYRLLGTDGEKP